MKRDIVRIDATGLTKYDAMQHAVIVREWIAAQRGLFRSSKRDVCRVCGRYESVAQPHHVVPLYMQARRREGFVDHRHEWLCPTHHKVVHAFIRALRHDDPQLRGESVTRFIVDLHTEELTMVIAIARLASNPDMTLAESLALWFEPQNPADDDEAHGTDTGTP